jgi:drug/metabolite transporter (DMT)-like permease
VPVLLSVLFMGETLDGAKIVGLLLAAAAVLLISMGGGGSSSGSVPASGKAQQRQQGGAGGLAAHDELAQKAGGVEVEALDAGRLGVGTR